MKKSLVALAVLAASGASFAQVTISGNLTAGFQSQTTGANNASGFGVDTAEVVFSAKEDLGGGMKASAKLGLVDASRGNTRTGVNTGFGPGDAELGLSGSFGQVTLSTTRGTDYLSGGVAGVGGTYMDGRVFNARTSTDSIAYALPVGPVTVGLSYSEPSDTLGLGQGTSGATGTTLGRQVVLSAQYTDGSLSADVGFLSTDRYNLGNPAFLQEEKNHYRGSVSYDLGVAKLGGGIESYNVKPVAGTTDSTFTNTLLAVSVPMGALTLGANWAQSQITNAQTTQGYGLKAAYALSKRTSVSADYTSWKGRDVNGAAATDSTSQYNLFLSHSF